jgi:hypothetical protein
MTSYTQYSQYGGNPYENAPDIEGGRGAQGVGSIKASWMRRKLADIKFCLESPRTRTDRA